MSEPPKSVPVVVQVVTPVVAEDKPNEKQARKVKKAAVEEVFNKVSPQSLDNLPKE